MINPLTMMKLNQTKNKFVSNHPKFAAFIKNFFSKKIEAGTIIEITVKRLDEEPVTSNMRVTESDLELLKSLKKAAVCDYGVVLIKGVIQKCMAFFIV